MYKITCFGSDKALRLIQRPCHHDERGMFTEAYRQDFLKAAGIGDNFVQDNYAVSNPGVIRGLHFQSGVYAQAKLVTVLQGVIFDVAVDMRPASPHYRQVYTFMLRAGEGLSLYVPRGFAHGYAVPHEEA
jgi:dTDP-4-dehydrorhamnose 3,5-epimerase